MLLRVIEEAQLDLLDCVAIMCEISHKLNIMQLQAGQRDFKETCDAEVL